MDSELKKAQRDRLKFIEFLLLFKGWATRQDISSHFGVGEAAATRDFRLYRDIAENNLQYNDSKKRWDINFDSFSSNFNFTPQEAFGKLRNKGTFDALEMGNQDGVLCPPRLSLPTVEVISALTRAISQKRALRIRYASASRPTYSCIIFPHSLVDNGLRWHVRAYDRNEAKFWDFVLGRIISIEEESIEPYPEESIDNDHQWFRFVRLELVPHPNRDNISNPESLEIEYGMTNGVLIRSVRAAAVGYWLRLWNVDSTPDHSLNDKVYQLWLQNHETLYDVDSAVLAPGR